MSALQFDAERHEYRLDGAIIPNVTRILEQFIDFGMVDAETMKRAQRRGTVVHIATALNDLGELVEESVHESIAPYLAAWRKFRKDTGFTPSHIELTVFSSHYGYCGTLDRVGQLNGNKILLDIKTGPILASVVLQTAAYQRAFEDEHKEVIDERYAIQLKNDGSYKLSKAYRRHHADFAVFQSVLNVNNWRKGNGYA